MTRESSSIQMNHLLAEMNQQGGFAISVLTDSQGLTIASSAGDGLDPECHSAVAAFLHKAILQVSKQLGMAGLHEISFFDDTGQCFICRPFAVDGQELILAVLTPHREHPYRRATNHTVGRIQVIWKHLWK